MYGHQKNNLVLFFAICACLSMSVGCESQKNYDSSAQTSVLPKLHFHRPKTGEQAVTRLRELVDSINSDAELPAPLEFKVREVIHGTGPSKHSHYYLVKDDQSEPEDHDDHDDHEEDIETAEKFHEVAVDCFTELYDIARWLPKVAANGDLPEDRWNTVKEVSGEMVSALESLAEDGQTTTQKRDTVRKNANEINAWIDKLDGAFGSN